MRVGKKELSPEFFLASLYNANRQLNKQGLTHYSYDKALHVVANARVKHLVLTFSKIIKKIDALQ